MFLIATGCEDYVPPEEAAAERHVDRVVVHCSSGDQTPWELRCEGGRWTGRTYNCSDDVGSVWNLGKLFAASHFLSKR